MEITGEQEPGLDVLRVGGQHDLEARHGLGGAALLEQDPRAEEVRAEMQGRLIQESLELLVRLPGLAGDEQGAGERLAEQRVSRVVLQRAAKAFDLPAHRLLVEGLAGERSQLEARQVHPGIESEGLPVRRARVGSPPQGALRVREVIVRFCPSRFAPDELLELAEGARPVPFGQERLSAHDARLPGRRPRLQHAIGHRDGLVAAPDLDVEVGQQQATGWSGRPRPAPPPRGGARRDRRARFARRARSAGEWPAGDGA